MFLSVVLGFVKRELKTRYAGTILGSIWIVIYPLTFTLVSATIFSLVFHDTNNGIPYFFYVWLGTSAWVYFSQGLLYSTRSFINNREIVSNVMFNWSAIILARVLVSLMDFLINILLFLIVMVLSGVSIQPIILLLPLLFMIQTLLIVGIGLVTSLLNVYFRDVQNLVEVFLQLLYFLTPIVYPVTIIPENIRWLIYLNPMTILIDSYRQIIFEGRVDIEKLLVVGVAGLIIFLVGEFFYKSYKDKLPELI